ncbi:hypothetical protein CC1G_06204 [Coprinopsis cinerea okayama7|uniref:Uncharacterized protein n=1 Tax=Coprinopsis cinerea (strain Okayama-7 / 130 / ATCC MYA-4618 / FGSC 9003) TaxID=240176 RepID=A8NV75_COPC7|nr:hypothetical protein CC1G_06204 [Coprinopsis cinerea okayama7\|eukprot:XP_001836617.1 hypothetical protein CC1G_06204 [Coprinopsis cinerea okayama7\
MAAPTQHYPPWLTPSQVVVTDAAGAVSTETTIVYLPLTYLGPSIPLGDLYTYGGSTWPPTLVTGFPSTTEATSPTDSTAIPPTTTTPTSATPTPTLSESTEPTLVPPTATSISTSSVTSGTPSETPTDVSPTGGLNRGQLVGVIVASILGLIFLFVFLLAMWLWCKGRRNRRSSQFYSVTPIEEDYYIVGEESRTPGEGSPRHSGEEADPFLQARSNRPMEEVSTEMGSRPAVPRVPVPNTSLSSSGSSSTNGSGYGTLLERPTLGILPPMSEEGEFGPGRYQLTPDEMRRLENESVLPREEEEYTGAYAIAQDPALAPPRLIDPDNTFGAHDDIPRLPPQVQHRARESVASNPSLGDSEDAALLTARRVRVEGMSQPGLTEGAGYTRSGFLDAIGLSNLTDLARMSWFTSVNSPTSSARNSGNSARFHAVPSSDNDVETGRGQLRPADSFGRVRDGLILFGTDGDRPSSHLSSTSASGNTIWHDAHSSLPGTPQLAMPPRAITPADVRFTEQDWLSGLALPTRPPPPAYEDPFHDNNSRTQSPSLPADVDPLDLPAPTALSHFASTSSMPDTGTVSSVGLSKYPVPPGLEYVAKGKSWSQDGSLSGASSTGFDSVTHRVRLSEISEHGTPATYDMLEDQPPNAQETWRSLASSHHTGGGFGELTRRTTFGLPQLTHPTGLIPSEQGSLHSMRSHINPPSLRSTGSAPASRHELEGSLSSNSSRPSAHGSTRSAGSAMSSIGQSLVRAGSIITDGRRRFDSSAPPHSPFGNRGFQTPPRAATPGGVGIFKHGEVPTIDGSNPSPNLEIPPVHKSPGSDRASTIRTVTSGSTAVPDGRERTLSTRTYGASSSIGEASEEPLPLSTPALSKDWTPAH